MSSSIQPNETPRGSNSLKPKAKIKFFLKIFKYFFAALFASGGLIIVHQYMSIEITTTATALSNAAASAESAALAMSSASAELSTSVNSVATVAAKISNNLSISVSQGLPVTYGDKGAIISKEFNDSLQACWYYHANYKHLHPYNLFWSVSVDEEDSSTPKFPKIRVIAEANWYGQNCVYHTLDNVEPKQTDSQQMQSVAQQVMLLGIEYTKHRIEAQMSESDDFIHIADSEAYYGSELIFGEKGRITERKILKSKKDYQCKAFGLEKWKSENCVFVPDIKDRKKIKDRIEDLLKKEAKETDFRFNILEIYPLFKPESLNAPEKKLKIPEKEFREAIETYIEKRKKLHNKLIEEGCGVLTIEPQLGGISQDKDKSQEMKEKKAIKPAIAFLCLKEGAPSHVRLMIRE
jgi:hypothetical protein